MRLVNLFYFFTGYLANPLTNFAPDESRARNSFVFFFLLPVWKYQFPVSNERDKDEQNIEYRFES